MFSVSDLPILATVPRSGTWFLRYAISFLCHLDRGGRLDDRPTGRIVGDAGGQCFDFAHFKGGPLFHVQGTLPTRHLFIGHTVCPGFGAMAEDVDWWKQTRFHVAGYDYLHDGLNYRYTPIDLAAYDYAPIGVAALERAAGKGRARPIVLVYRNPLDQALSYFRYCQDHKSPAYNALGGRPLSSVPFDEYLFGSALPSYAKQFVSFQAMAERHPDRVLLVPYEQLMSEPEAVLTCMLDHLAGTSRSWPMLDKAVWLARREHMTALERELDRSLDGTRIGRGSHINRVDAGHLEARRWGGMRRDIELFLLRLGVDITLFEWPTTLEKAVAAA